MGGGAGGLAAAWELTATPELRERHEVCVYQSGWRLGGKGASGRNAAMGQRIEEHGLHIWFGFYQNAFRMIQAVYEELARDPDSPLATWRQAFEPFDDVVLYTAGKDGWHQHAWHFPPNDGSPEQDPPSSLADLAERAISWMVKGGLRGANDVIAEEHRHALAHIHEALRGHAQGTDRGFLVRSLDGLRELAWNLHHAEQDARSLLAEYAMTLDFGLTIGRGIVADDVLEQGFAAINGEEFCDWLRRHGIRDRTLSGCALLRAFYQLCFGYEGGDRARPCVAAGKATQAFLRILLTYQGAVMWRMQAGMGDAIFGPLYEVLRRRGVRFEFFQHVSRLGLSADGANVACVEVIPQLGQSAGEYAPLVEVNGLPCWPSEPRWELLPDGAELRARGVNFERQANPLDASPLLLEAGRDFDDVVLAIPVGALPAICSELAAHSPRFAEMLGASRTVATQALQLWLSADASALGISGRDTVAGAYLAPLDTYADMSHLISREAWSEPDQVRHIAYFCGVMSDEDARSHDAAEQRARDDGLTYLRSRVSALWPDACGASGESIDWSLLVDPHGRSGEARYEAQYWRANTEGSERYVLTPPGSVEKRMRPGESGFENLYLAGDWTRNGICGGSVEAAVTSGRMAARALCGQPSEIPGLSRWLEAD